ncbi:hypothetical protein [Poritiphilus flavus]|uniref:Uncharacterized protein n=1 Tax=Poritiphilus flavus TaxID=2697053 RepID=A0A6L9EEI9_9FLAO|nr:hypothetical protein [Poritiphilus flavus]NAS12928.1 hypothetical protein [Poritiphilus flavus]
MDSISNEEYINANNRLEELINIVSGNKSLLPYCNFRNPRDKIKKRHW